MKNQVTRGLQIIQSNNGNLLYDNQRVIMTPSSGIGTLRKNLVETIGYERTKTFLIRYGWNLGASDAKVIMEKLKRASVEEVIMVGPRQHMLLGHAKIKGEIKTIDSKNKRIHIEGTWVNSYEAQEHLSLFGFSHEAVCHILVGYASGYTSEVLGTTVIYKESTCEGMGHSCCHWVGKSLADWNGEVDNDLGFFEENNLIHELENAYEQIVVERDNLNKTLLFHKKLMELIMLGKDLQSIAEMVHDFLGVPILISSDKKRTLAAIGLSKVDIEELHSEIPKFVDNRVNKMMNSSRSTQSKNNLDIIPTTLFSSAKQKHYLASPIYVRQKLVGYCTIILQSKEIKEIKRMILERTSAAASVFLLNQEIAIEAEQRSRGHFLEQIINAQLTKEEMLKWGHYIAIDLEHPYYILVINQEHKISSVLNKKQLECNDQLIVALTAFFHKKQVRFLIGQRMNHIVILLQESFKEGNLAVPHFEKILEHCKSQQRSRKFKMGISLLADDIVNARDHYNQALAAIQIASSQKRVVSYDELGAVGILIQAGNESVIKKFTNSLLGNLIDYDRKKDTESIKTVYVYLRNGGNLELTANELALSISGLRYRLQKIEKLLGFEIRDPHLSYQLYLAIQLLIVSGEIEIEI